jgi:hypothetical protein
MIIGIIVMSPAIVYLAINFTWLFIVILIFCWPVMIIAKEVEIYKLKKEIKTLKGE